MKFFIVFALISAVASAGVVKPTAVSAEVQEIIAAIQSPSTDPATAVALEQILLEALGISANPEPIAVGPAVVDAFEPISVGPAIVDALEPISVGPAIVGTNPISVGPAVIDFPLPDGGAVSAPVEILPVAVAPVVPAAPAVPSTPLTPATPLVQIILNLNQAEAVEASPVAVAPVVVAPVVEAPEPIIIVESAAEPIAVPSPIIVAPSPVVIPESVSVVDSAPVSVVETAPVVVEPVIIGTPILPSPAVVLPETLN